MLQQWVLSKQEPIGGMNKIVEIDEARIGKKKYNTGRIIRSQWVFGGIECDTKKVFVLPNRSAETLLPLIRKYVAPGSIIHSDKWRAMYDSLCNDTNYTHKIVNHSVNFVNPETGVNTQNIERFWRDMRAKKIPSYGIRNYHHTHHLAEYLFK